MEEEDRYVMSKAPERVQLREGVECVGEGVLATPPGSGGRGFNEIEVLFTRGRRAVTGVLTGVTIGDLLEGKVL